MCRFLGLYHFFYCRNSTYSSSLYPSFLAFLLESWQNISRNSLFFPFHSAFSPSYFCLLKGWKVPSEPLFLALKSIFRSLRSRSLSVIKVFQSLKSPLRLSWKSPLLKRGGLWGKSLFYKAKIQLFSEKCGFLPLFS